MKIRAHVLISGLVQGVWFRASTKEKADQLKLAGWVRNTSQGDVEAVFEGEEHVVDEMITWCHHGPPYAQVVNVAVMREPHSDELKRFDILRDAK
jgi:acylphosphatase